jgi:hypothetical protein
VATGTYAPDPDLRVTDPNGVPVPGGLVWTYIAGTTTPAPTYTDVGLIVPNTNPIVAGSDGRFVAFLAGGNSYKFVYEMPAVPPAHGAVIITRDNILAVTTIVPGTGGGIVQVTNLIGTVNDFALISGCSLLVCRPSTPNPLTITGLANGVVGQRVTIHNASGSTSAPVFLPNQSASSLSANRLWNMASSGPTPLGGANGLIGGYATYQYDDFSRWVLVAHDQGPWITPAFNAADFTATGGTWTVASGNVATMKYRLAGRTLHILFQLNGTSIGSTPSALLIGNNEFGGFTLQPGLFPIGYTTDFTGNPYVSGQAGNALNIQKASAANFAAGPMSMHAGWFGEVT